MVLCNAERTHSDVVGIDVVRTKNIWICFPDFHPSCVDWKHNVKLSFRHNKMSTVSWHQTFVTLCSFSSIMSIDRQWAIMTRSSRSAEASTLSGVYLCHSFHRKLERGNGRLLRDLQGRIFLYLFLLLFSGFWPSFRGYSSLHSCCWSTW